MEHRLFYLAVLLSLGSSVYPQDTCYTYSWRRKQGTKWICGQSKANLVLWTFHTPVCLQHHIPYIRPVLESLNGLDSVALTSVCRYEDDLTSHFCLLLKVIYSNMWVEPFHLAGKSLFCDLWDSLPGGITVTILCSQALYLKIQQLQMESVCLYPELCHHSLNKTT